MDIVWSFVTLAMLILNYSDSQVKAFLQYRFVILNLKQKQTITAMDLFLYFTLSTLPTS